MKRCPCGSNQPYEQCCRPLIEGERPARTAEELMRSRYTAFTKAEVDYILQTVHPDMRSQHDEVSIRKWAINSQWLGLEILQTDAGGPEDEAGQVEFIAEYTQKSERIRHHEIAEFKKTDKTWYFYDGNAPKPETFSRKEPKVGRNDPCPCGSGKKFKKCCGR